MEEVPGTPSQAIERATPCPFDTTSHASSTLAEHIKANPGSSSDPYTQTLTPVDNTGALSTTTFAVWLWLRPVCRTA